jgi:Tfp pilus assembly protein PilF
MNWNNEIPKSAIIIVEDGLVSNVITSFLKSSGVNNVRVELDGQSAWTAMQRETYELVIMGWKLSTIEGPALFNRIRGQERYTMTPLLVISGKIDKDSFRLLEEFPCSAMMSLPMDVTTLRKNLFRLWEEKDWYLKNSDLIQRMFTEAENKPENIKSAIDAVMKRAPNPIPAALLVAKQLNAFGYLGQSQAIYKQILRKDEDCLQALNGLGRSLLLAGKTTEASMYLRVAWRLSENNIERLCMLGEIELSQHDSDAARQYFDMALKIDKNDPRAASGVVVCDNFEGYVRAHTGGALPRNFASICNTIGVWLVRDKNFEKGFEQYNAALNLLTHRGTQARVMFNMGLGYIRAGSESEALKWFMKAKEYGGSAFKKPAEYLERMQSGVAVGQSTVTDHVQIDSINTVDELTDIDESWFEEDKI